VVNLLLGKMVYKMEDTLSLIMGCYAVLMIVFVIGCFLARRMSQVESDISELTKGRFDV
jgi:hypothetical protein